MMNNNERIQELMNRMTSFQKPAYHKSELLGEMLGLQGDMVKLTYCEEHAENANLKIYDVENHLAELNEQCGGIAEQELKEFKNDCKDFSNLIRAEISGQRGEYRAFRTLDFIKSENRIIKNVELSDGELRTEIDALVITKAGLTIVEVKNTAKDIFIDERGDYYRTGEFLKWDCNIAEKMAVKETLLRKLLTSEEVKIPTIRKIVVFTDNRIQVQNKYIDIETCFVSQLAYKIDGFASEDFYDLDGIKKIVEQASVREVYPFEFDVEKFKRDYAVLMAKLEAANASDEQSEMSSDYIEREDIQDFEDGRNTIGKTAIVAGAIMFVTLVLTSAFKRRGNSK